MSQAKSITDQLAEVLGHHLDVPLSEIEQEIHRLKEGFSNSLESLQGRFTREARALLHGNLAEAASAVAGQAAASLEAQHEGRLASLATACRRILSAKTQAEILAALADGAAHFSSRSVLFISKGDYLMPWEIRGAATEEIVTGIRARQIPKRSDTTLSKSCFELRPLLGDLNSHRENAQLVELLGDVTPEKILCLPVVIHGKATAVLYTDRVPDLGNPLNQEALSLLVDMSQVRIELHALETRLGIKSTRSVTVEAATPETVPPPPPVVPTPAVSMQAPAERVPVSEPEPAIEPVRMAPEPMPLISEPEPEIEATAMLASPLIGSAASAPAPAPVQEVPAAPVFSTIPEYQATTRLEMHDLPQFGAVSADSAPPAPQFSPADKFWSGDVAASAGPGVDIPPAAVMEPSAEDAIEIDLDSIFSTEAGAPQPPLTMEAPPAAPAAPHAVWHAGETRKVVEFPSPPVSDADIPIVPPQPQPAFIAPAAELAPPPPPMPPPIPPELERLHNEAKRFARLLVSEIKLYNEQAVNEGRRQKDIYDRLKKDIDRSRQLYDQRVSEQITRRIDYFHDELVRILGANDPATLGSGYPGPRLIEDE